MIRILLIVAGIALVGAAIDVLSDFQKSLDEKVKAERLTPVSDEKQQYRITDLATHRIFTITSP